MSRVGSSLRRLLFVEVRADPPSANGIFARNVRQIDQEALLRISYFPPRPRTSLTKSLAKLLKRYFSLNSFLTFSRRGEYIGNILSDRKSVV